MLHSSQPAVGDGRRDDAVGFAAFTHPLMEVLPAFVETDQALGRLDEHPPQFRVAQQSPHSQFLSPFLCGEFRAMANERPQVLNLRRRKPDLRQIADARQVGQQTLRRYRPFCRGIA